MAQDPWMTPISVALNWMSCAMLVAALAPTGVLVAPLKACAHESRGE